MHRLTVRTLEVEAMPKADIPNSLAMAEMTALVAAVYRKYDTKVAPGFDDVSPAITSRFELFYDEVAPRIAVSGRRISS